jgi:hypothetical protein
VVRRAGGGDYGWGTAQQPRLPDLGRRRAQPLRRAVSSSWLVSPPEAGGR